MADKQTPYKKNNKVSTPAPPPEKKLYVSYYSPDFFGAPQPGAGFYLS